MDILTIKSGDKIEVTLTITVEDITHHEHPTGGSNPWSTIFYDGGEESYSLEFPLHLASSEQATIVVKEAPASATLHHPVEPGLSGALTIGGQKTGYEPTWENLREMWMARNFTGFVEKNEFEVGFDAFLEKVGAR